ncbi:LacI family DNA-binding transcriptional regulator [Marinitenerispora sediminis]|uniref:LacI family transcriptional regulator n=1 Tax=Marinitenerispora sediminis TaxID=1931232 RepID=A0A368SYD4_9ACTN|nr:LacI family DNA-binding transcriptional regulator [Marinitenerispora sediminis]RCV47881.1 LacI family transcriptional regulator [Marinitenerispora sediminis]RCV49109.1 LacI family transcriptional regulator [Marinitenerispora sediminis]RCV52139.1 LacI family transcriptional regulator [Marinitenerispora sediminis]
MVTIADVARHAGVSISTVSYVLSGKRSISAETEGRVRAAIRDLGYLPNAGARALASSRSNVLALVVPLRSDMYLPVLMQFVTGVVTAARAHEHDVLLLTQEEGADGLRRVAGTALTDAVIVMDVQQHDPRLEVLRGLPQPSALIGVPADPRGLACVDLDFAASAASCVAHLADLGHRDLGFVGPPEPVYQRGTSFARRALAGFTSALRSRALAGAGVPCTPDYRGVRRALAELRARVPGLTGLVVHNEEALPVLLDVLHSDGLRVPDDLSVAAICPDQQAQSLAVPVTAVAIPAEELAADAVRAVMRELEGVRDRTVRLRAPELRVRASTGPVR